MYRLAKELVEHENYLEALRVQGIKNPMDAVIMGEAQPELILHHPRLLVHEAWCEYQATKRFWDSDLPPDLWDVRLRQDVRAYGRQMDYMIARARQGQ